MNVWRTTQEMCSICEHSELDREKDMFECILDSSVHDDDNEECFKFQDFGRVVK